MTSVQIKNVPDEVCQVLRRRAAAANQSLQEFLLAHLIELTSAPTLGEVLDRAGSHSGGSLTFGQAVEIVRGDRDRR